MTDYPRCATCKFYEARAGDFEGDAICSNPRIGESALRSDAPYIAYPYDEGGCMYPSPDFGCVLHEPKEPLPEREP